MACSPSAVDTSEAVRTGDPSPTRLLTPCTYCVTVGTASERLHRAGSGSRLFDGAHIGEGDGTGHQAGIRRAPGVQTGEEGRGLARVQAATDRGCALRAYLGARGSRRGHGWLDRL